MKIFVVKWIPGYADAITLPPLGIFTEGEISDKLMWHEKGHWDQYEEWGFWKYYIKILWQYARYGPINAPVEADATKRGKALLKQQPS